MIVYLMGVSGCGKSTVGEGLSAATEGGVYLDGVNDDGGATGLASGFPATLELEYLKEQELRYGENPHQKAAFYREPLCRGASVAGAQQLQGKATHRLIVPGSSLPDDIYVDLLRQPGAPPMAPVVNGWVEVVGGSGRYQLVGFDLFAEAPFRSQLTEVANRAGFTSDWLTQPGALVLGAAAAAASVRGSIPASDCDIFFCERAWLLNIETKSGMRTAAISRAATQ